MVKTETNKNVETVKMVTNAMRVMGIIKNAENPLTHKDVCNLSKINPGTVQRILNTLESSGWVKRISGDYYKVSNKVDMVTDRRYFFRALADVAENILPAYVEKKQLPMNVVVMEGKICRIIQQVRTNSLIDYVPPVNSELPFYSCSGGKILLSESEDSIINNLFELSDIVSFTSNTICDLEEFRKELSDVRANGYATDYHEILELGSCVAVPIRDKKGSIVAALSYGGIIGGEKEDLKEYVPALQEASAEITEALFC